MLALETLTTCGLCFRYMGLLRRLRVLSLGGCIAFSADGFACFRVRGAGWAGAKGGREDGMVLAPAGTGGWVSGRCGRRGLARDLGSTGLSGFGRVGRLGGSGLLRGGRGCAAAILS